MFNVYFQYDSWNETCVHLELYCNIFILLYYCLLICNVILLGFWKLVDNIYNAVPPYLRDSYLKHISDKKYFKHCVNICPTSGKTTFTYYPIIIHAVKN